MSSGHSDVLQHHMAVVEEEEEEEEAEGRGREGRRVRP
jgi:hypothetical protein